MFPEGLGCLIPKHLNKMRLEGFLSTSKDCLTSDDLRPAAYRAE